VRAAYVFSTPALLEVVEAGIREAEGRLARIEWPDIFKGAWEHADTDASETEEERGASDGGEEQVTESEGAAGEEEEVVEEEDEEEEAERLLAAKRAEKARRSQERVAARLKVSLRRIKKNPDVLLVGLDILLLGEGGTRGRPRRRTRGSASRELIASLTNSGMRP
jgi:hypothetical protein